MYNDWKRIGLNVDDDELEAMIKAKAKEAEAKVRTKGATRQQLAGREEMALRMLGANLSLRTQTEIWAEAGILTTAPSLRAYFKRYYPEEWAAYLSRTARGQLKNRSFLDAPPVGAEKAEIQAFLRGEQPQQVGANETGTGRKEEATPTKETKPAATGEGAPMKSLNQRSEKAKAMVEQLSQSDD